MVLSVTIPVAMIAVASLTAYALTRLQFRGRNVLFLAFVATMMIPSHVTLIPNYKIIIDMHLANTYLALFLSSMFTGANAFNIFFFRQFFLSFPKDLENAAIIDGCSRFGVFLRVILPQCETRHCDDGDPVVPQRVEFVPLADAVITDYDRLTLTVGLKYLKEWETNWAVLLAGATISIVPILIVFFSRSSGSLSPPR